MVNELLDVSICVYIYAYLNTCAYFFKYIMNCNPVFNVDYFTVALISEQLFQPGCCAEKGVLDVKKKSGQITTVATIASMHECFDMDMRDSTASLPHCVA